MVVNGSEKLLKVAKYICNNCKKEYNDRAGLWRYKKKCSETNVIKSDDLNDKDLIMMLIKQNTHLIEQNAELIKKVLIIK